ncbi:SulP family inorganic anion transporter [Tuwongella immobilis]|uniref:SLC26A/SulP transporter domain-containing protein n=1 Tax=Tuwongella immobilis TaxID=692036 RepID=A0A6C2YTF0_9BACT|nr:SulP family inorganic anion transporter [Tuwongella immobilis]VIP04309.1 sulfate transporter : Carbonic anhydrase OS=Planctomyces brasiliensis (strain ATCC 49424 / DSM 5305 / JCM 21570 / NBRC 103401 / IFAM 1448) GN=Plabr_2947 PE=4 SV=1: Sulfate_tra_GLY: Sulfate_transp: Pro_CA [Tuwongella immobilis]VTS05981.1 sulfate transporter : Carbonic anhydrase OS=Planctomyces brasiliensis (strain ATCC 49424 / DSM 5305 / JCM 21570 / NBRC 103401 / IFAM 1448) GN=Plabr_2947 PE=4 SV=1: Sulfate_tra_GLY: Sulfate
MAEPKSPSTNSPLADPVAGLVVFLVALPLCLGVALASNAPPFAGVLAGVVGGILVGMLSGSHTSVSGPAAGLTAIVAAEIASLGSFQAFLLAVFLAGILQIGLGLIRAGSLSAFVPTGVIKGLLAAIGIILILKQIPHLFGHDPDPEGDMSFLQIDKETTFSELGLIVNDSHLGASVIGLFSLALLFTWDRIKALKYSLVPAPLVVVLLGMGLAMLFQNLGGYWLIGPSHLVAVPVSQNVGEFLNFLQLPDFSQLGNRAVYLAAITIAIVASLETLLNLEAVDKIDPRQRVSPASRELVAQGVGNMTCGLIGGLPVTSVIVRSSVNINAGARTKLAAIFHGVLLLACVMFFEEILNLIPLSCLAAILLHTGFKLASFTLAKQMWREGWNQFIPFLVTVVAIVLTDLLIGVIIGLLISIAFILHSNIRRPLRIFIEKHIGGEVTRLELASQVSFLNRAAIVEVLDSIPRGGHVLIDATTTDYIDPDILSLFREFHATTGPARGVEVSLRGFRERYHLEDQTQFIDYSSREMQHSLTPKQVLDILMDGHQRFRTGRRLTRDLARQLNATAAAQHPLAVVLSCMDSRAPAELIFDVGLGDIFVVRVAGNIVRRKVLGSIEYGTAVAGAKLVLVMGHTRCGAVGTAVRLWNSTDKLFEMTGCQHLDPIIQDIHPSVDLHTCENFHNESAEVQERIINEAAERNIRRMVALMPQESQTLAQLLRDGKIMIVGAMYDVVSGEVRILDPLPTPQPVSE